MEAHVFDASRENDLVRALLASCCEQVLETMFFSSPLDPTEPPLSTGQARVHSRLAFRGRPAGAFEVDADPQVSRHLAASFLGLAEADISPQQVIDVLGEFANMACGSALSSLARVEYFHLDPPQTAAVDCFTPSIKGVRRAFVLEGGTLGVCLRVEFDPE